MNATDLNKIISNLDSDFNTITATGKKTPITETRPVSSIYGRRSGSVNPIKVPRSSSKVTDFYDGLIRGDNSVPVERFNYKSTANRSRPLTS